MAAVGFDTLKFVRRLMAAGVPEEQAEAQAEIMAEAFLLNVDALVTKDYLDARLAEHDARMEARMDVGFAEQGARIEARFADLEARMELRFAGIDTRFAEVDGKFRLLMWRLAGVMAGTVVPAVH